MNVVEPLFTNFGGVTFFSGDHLYADNIGVILSEDALDLE